MSGDQLGEYTDNVSFRKFDHVERGKHRAVDGICQGTCFIFPKLDGTNGSVWAEFLPFSPASGLGGFEKLTVRVGSRNRILRPESDNAGFHAFVKGESDEAERLRMLVLKNPSYVFYGEWLVPHTIQCYKKDAWRKFYIFDVFDREAGAYIEYNTYRHALDNAGVPFIPAIRVENPTGPELDEIVAKQDYLCKPGEFGEGIVVKNYGWRNQFDRQPWMKVLRDGFMDKKGRPAVGSDAGATEEMIAEALVDGHLVEKEFNKGLLRLAESMKVVFEGAAHDNYIPRDHFVEAHRGKVIGILLAQVFNSVIDEEFTARRLKKFGYPTVDFRVLRGAVTRRVKELKPELFS